MWSNLTFGRLILQCWKGVRRDFRQETVVTVQAMFKVARETAMKRAKWLVRLISVPAGNSFSNRGAIEG